MSFFDKIQYFFYDKTFLSLILLIIFGILFSVSLGEMHQKYLDKKDEKDYKNLTFTERMDLLSKNSKKQSNALLGILILTIIFTAILGYILMPINLYQKFYLKYTSGFKVVDTYKIEEFQNDNYITEIMRENTNEIRVLITKNNKLEEIIFDKSNEVENEDKNIFKYTNNIKFRIIEDGKKEVVVKELQFDFNDYKNKFDENKRCYLYEFHI